MIVNDLQTQVTLERIARLQQQMAHLRRSMDDPANYHASSAGFLTEVDRMQREVREYLFMHPSEQGEVA